MVLLKITERIVVAQVLFLTFRVVFYSYLTRLAFERVTSVAICLLKSPIEHLGLASKSEAITVACTIIAHTALLPSAVEDATPSGQRMPRQNVCRT